MHIHIAGTHGGLGRKPITAWATVLIRANVEQKAHGRRPHHTTNCDTGPIRDVLESNLMTRVIPWASLLLVAHALASCSDSKPVAASAPPAPPVTVAHPLQKMIT